MSTSSVRGANLPKLLTVPQGIAELDAEALQRFWFDYHAGLFREFKKVYAAIDALAGTVASMTSINSIQYGSITISGTDTSDTATITSVDTSKAVLHFLGFTASTNDVQKSPSITLTDATTVTATRTAALGTTVVNFVVVEYA